MGPAELVSQTRFAEGGDIGLSPPEVSPGGAHIGKETENSYPSLSLQEL